MRPAPTTFAAFAALTLCGCGAEIPPPAAALAGSAPAPAAWEPRPLPPAGVYRAAELRDPFRPAPREDERDAAAAPDMARAKTPAERFALDELEMVGTLSGRGAARALVRDPGGRTHALAAGDYLGPDHGRIQSIRGQAIVLVEVVRGDAGWLARERQLALRPADAEETSDEP